MCFGSVGEGDSLDIFFWTSQQYLKQRGQPQGELLCCEWKYLEKSCFKFKMSQWQDVLRLDSVHQGRVSQLYEGKFPREIRHSLCVPIESQNWDLAAMEEHTAGACFHALLEDLEELCRRSVQENNFLQGPDYPGMKHYLLFFEDKPLNLAVILSEILTEEKKILASASEAQGCSSPAANDKWKELDDNVDELKRQTLEVKKKMKSLEFLNENIDFIQVTWQSQVEQHIGLAKSQGFVEEQCHKRTNFMTQTKLVVLQQIENILHLAEKMVAALTDVELPQWKRRQQMACIGCPADTCLDHLQKWFTAVTETLLRAREQLQKLQDLNNKYNSPDAPSIPGTVAQMAEFTQSLFTKLLTNALVVEKQPFMSSLPQRSLILKTGVRFTLKVRFLANLPECVLKVKLVFDKDVEEAKTIKGFRHFDFNKDESKLLDSDSPCGGLVAEFGNMSLKEKKTRTKGSCESRLVVTEELHVIKIVTQFQHAGLQFNIEASSLPVVVISSTNQVANAWASVMWYNVLCAKEPWNLSLFVDPPALSWQQLSQVLSWQFASVGQRGLDEHQLSTLRQKFVDDPDDLIPWNKFSKKENHWLWIDGILDLIKKHLPDIWRDGSIMGFVSRERTKVLLQEKPSGTFLLRFSESNKDGAITFSWVDHCDNDTYVHAVDPYTKEELLLMSLPNIINHYSLRAQKRAPRHPLIYLYPDIHKDQAFGRYYGETSATKKVINGYVKRDLLSESDNPTPPPSPPRETPTEDMDTDGMWSDVSYQSNLDDQELWTDLLDLPELPDLLTFFQETTTTNFDRI